MSERTNPRRVGPAIATLVAVLVVLVAAEATARVLEPMVDPTPNWGTMEIDVKFAQMETLALEGGGVDVVFLGSSVVNIGIDPEAFVTRSNWAESAYNASLNAASPRLLEAWATEVVFPFLKPDVVVIGLGSRAFNANGVSQELIFRAYIGSRGRAEHLGTASVGQLLESRAEDVSSLFRIRRRIRSPGDLLSDLLTDKEQTAFITNYGNQTPRSHPYRVSTAFQDRVTQRVLNDYVVGADELAALERLVRAAEESGAVVYLLDIPAVDADYVPLHPRGADDYAAYKAAFARFVSDHRVLTGNPPTLVTKPELFVDPLHLNAEGVDLMMDWLSQMIERP